MATRLSRPNTLRRIRQQQRDPFRRKPLKATARFSRDVRQLSLCGLVPTPPAIPIPPSEMPPKVEEQLELEDLACGTTTTQAMTAKPMHNSTTTTATKDARAWEELARAGDRLPDWGVSLARTLRIIRDLLRRFELPSTAEMEAVRIFLTGLDIAIGTPLDALDDGGVTAVAVDAATDISMA